METIHTPCLVIGVGIAGCATALKMAQMGIDVVVISKAQNLLESNTSWAQGGIIYQSEDPLDHQEQLKDDIMKAGDFLNFIPAVDKLVEERKEIVDEYLLDDDTIPFDRDPATQAIHFTQEGGHNVPRIIHVKDRTGYYILQHLQQRILKHPRITVRTGELLVDLLTSRHQANDLASNYEFNQCLGAYVWDSNEQKIKTYFSQYTVLATGGLGQIYLHTTNPLSAVGDGIAVAARAGVTFQNLEYLQFHPTTLYTQKIKNRPLISEALRGEGAILLDENFKPFMEQYHPQGCLAPRDVVARAINDLMVHRKLEHVWLDISHKPADWIKNRFPHITQTCLNEGYDITQKPIPVVPAAHYSCGGILTDLKARSSLNRLYAVGEVACTGLHGANRLASTSLLEALIWGKAAALDIVEKMATEKFTQFNIPEWNYGTEEVDPLLIKQDWSVIKQTMWNYLGLVRTTKHLERASRILSELASEIDVFYAQAKLNHDIIELRHGILAANCIMSACLNNHTSKGCHFISK